MSRSGQRFSKLFLLTAALRFLTASIGRASHVAIDNSLGTAIKLTGPTFSILPSMGQDHGTNLFLSFHTFDLSAGGTVSFGAQHGLNLANVIARVTGGPATIDGAIDCTIPNASFFLIDPSGVVFGPEAQLNVHRSFIVTTANEIKLQHGGSFGGDASKSDVLTTAAPAAFGFLGKSPASVTNSAALAVGPEQGLAIVAGKIAVSAGGLQADSGKITLVAAGGIGQVDIKSANGAPVTADVSGLKSFSDIGLAANTAIEVSGRFGGSVNIDAKNLSMGALAPSVTPVYAEIDSNSLGSGTTAGKSITLNLSGTLSLMNSFIQARTGAYVNDIPAAGAGTGGNIVVHANAVTLNANSDGLYPSGLIAYSVGTGAGGGITIDSQTLDLHNEALIDVQPLGSGNAGPVVIHSHDVLLDAEGSGTESFGIVASSQEFISGQPGNISIHAGTLKIYNEGYITADAGSPGTTGGVISISANKIDINAAQSGFTGIASDSDYGGDAGGVRIHANIIDLEGSGSGTGAQNAAIEASTEGGGNAGRITIAGRAPLSDKGGSAPADSLSVADGGEITAFNIGKGNGGQIKVNAKTIQLIRSTPSAPTAISTDTDDGSGAGSSLSIKAGSLTIASGAGIQAITTGSAAGGNIDVSANRIRIDGAGSKEVTGIAAQTNADGATGNAGSIIVDATTLSLTRRGRISDDTYDSGDAGNISVSAGYLLIDGALSQGRKHPTGIDATSREDATGAGGQINIDAGRVRVINQGLISADTEGAGNAGNIDIRSTDFFVDGLAFSNSLTGVTTESVKSPSQPAATGASGSISVYASHDLELIHGKITTASAQGGNSLQVTSKNEILLSRGSAIVADAVGNGGDVAVSATSLVSLEGGSSLSARGNNGGNVSVDALRLDLHTGNTIKADGQQNGGNLNLDAQEDVLLGSATATGAKGQSGSIENAPAQNDVASIVTPPVPSFDRGLTLVPTCGMQAGPDQSSFTLEGGNGLPTDPGQTSFGDPLRLMPGKDRP